MARFFSKKRVFLLTVLVIVIGLITIRYITNSYNWKFRDIRKKMTEVRYSDAIESIDVSALPATRLSFMVKIKPNYLSQKEVFYLGNMLVDLIDKGIAEDKEYLLYGDLQQISVIIHPVPDQESSIGYWYEFSSISSDGVYRSSNDIKYGGVKKWYFRGCIDGRSYGSTLQEVIEMEASQ